MAKKTTATQAQRVLEFSSEAGCENKIHYKQSDLINYNPKNPRQSKFVQYYYDNNVPLILLNGWAGTGKTYTALHAALSQVLDPSTHYEKIVIVRSAVESGMSQGFLPGLLSEKNEPYELPYKMVVGKLFNIPSESHYTNLKAQGLIEFMSTTYLRGITLDNTIVIIEECQNLDYLELKSITTRIGEGSRIILTGDITQDDLSRKKKTSGLYRYLEVLESMEHKFHKTINFELEDIERSGLCKAFIIADYKIEQENDIKKKGA